MPMVPVPPARLGNDRGVGGGMNRGPDTTRDCGLARRGEAESKYAGDQRQRNETLHESDP